MRDLAFLMFQLSKVAALVTTTWAFLYLAFIIG